MLIYLYYRMAPIRKRKATRYIPRPKKRVGTKLPASSSIIDRGVDLATKNKTMYAPSVNLRNHNSSKITSNIGPFGERWVGKLKYVDKFKQNVVVGEYTELLFNLNSLFDPDRTGVGHQPRGFDQLSGIYSRYRVLKTAYKLTMLSTSQSSNLIQVVHQSNTTSSAQSAANALEQGNSMVRMFNAFQRAIPLKGIIALNTLTGNSLEAYRSDDKYEGTVTTNPTELLILHVGIEGTTSVAANVEWLVELEYDCEMWDPFELPPS